MPTTSTYSVTPSTTQLIVGQSVSFTVITTGVSNGTHLYWTNTGTARYQQIAVSSGTFTINSGTSIVTLSSTNGSTASGETIVFEVRTTSTTGTIVATAPTVYIYQPIVTAVNVSVRSFTVAVPVTPFIPILGTGGYNTLTWSISPGLPAGLALNTANGQISGTPTLSSTATLYTITVTDQINQTSSRSITMSVISYILEIGLAKARPPVAIYNEPIEPFSPVIVTHIGNGSLTWSVSPALPSGVHLAPVSGIISGTPTITDSFGTYTITVVDQSGQTKTQNFELKVARSQQLILSDYYNYLRESLFELAGTTASGYGCVLLCDPIEQVGGHYPTVQTFEWNQMHEDLLRCIVHQNGTSTNNLILANTGTIINDSIPDRNWTELQFLEVNPGKVAPNQLAVMRTNTYEISPDEWVSDWVYGPGWNTITSNGYITAVSYTWFHPIQMNYFFNLGSSITPELQTTSTNALVWEAWEPLIKVVNSITFGRTEFQAALENGGIFQRTVTRGSQGPTSKAITITFQIIGSVLTVSIEFLADYYKKKKKGKGKHGAGYGNYIVALRISSDFVTKYSTDYLGGIRAPIPQSQLMGNTLSAPAAPVPIFSFATGSQSTATTITLRNNSTQTCNISNMSLTGYTTGTLSTSTMVIAPHTSNTFNLRYSGNVAGYYQGNIRILSNINNLTLFTQLNIGGVVPNHFTASTNTNDLIVQDFIVDHAGGQYRDFIISTISQPGFSYEIIPSGIYSNGGFRVTFNPHGLPNGLYYKDIEVNILPSDTALETVTIHVPINITTNILNQELGHWISALGLNNDVIGFSYGYIGGYKYITVGVGSSPAIVSSGNPLISQLRSENTFTTWQDVYRIPLTSATPVVYHVNDYQIKGTSETSVGYHFGVGNAQNSICSIKDDGRGNLSIVMNTVREQSTDAAIATTISGLVNAFYYYDETSDRTNQLENIEDFVDGIFTHYFAGFNNTGHVITTLVNPNLFSN